MIDKISENLEVIFKRDRERIAKKDEQIKAHVKAMKILKRDRKSLVEELDLLLLPRKQDLVEFKAKRQEYYKLAGIAVKENEQLDDDIKHARIGKANSQYMNVMNGAGACLFGGFLGAKRIRIFDWLNAATGWHLTPEQYMEVGTNIQTLKQAFNVRQGLQPKDSRVGDRLLGLPSQTRGANKGRSVDIDTMMKDYWELFEWDRETGIPSRECIDKVASIV